MHVLDPTTGRRISPVVAAALCIKPRRQMTERQIVNVDTLKAAWAEFTTMRHFASKRCGRDSIDCWVGGDADLLPLDAQALHSVFLVGEDLSGKR